MGALRLSLDTRVLLDSFRNLIFVVIGFCKEFTRSQRYEILLRRTSFLDPKVYSM